jgi:hypothetical protein
MSTPPTTRVVIAGVLMVFGSALQASGVLVFFERNAPGRILVAPTLAAALTLSATAAYADVSLSVLSKDFGA